jgi:hypothetical protein
MIAGTGCGGGFAKNGSALSVCSPRAASPLTSITTTTSSSPNASS